MLIITDDQMLVEHITFPTYFAFYVNFNFKFEWEEFPYERGSTV